MPEGFDRRYQFDSPAAAIDAMVHAVRAHPYPRDSHRVTLTEARGLVLAERAILDRDSPAFDQSSMDGYAVRLADLAGDGETTLTVTGECRIGAPPIRMPSGHAAVRIATGAPIPIAGVEAILKREDVTEVESSGRVTSIIVPRATIAKTPPGQFIRRRAENARAGAVVLEAGTMLTSATIGALAAIGHATPRVHRAVRVAIITTGDEVVEPGATPEAHQIRNANAAALQAALGANRWIVVERLIHVRDDDAAVLGSLRDAAQDCDAIVLSGGVSMGHRDPVRAAIDAMGASVIFHGLPQRPGKPMLGALLSRPVPGSALAIPVFGLPGNPVSTLVTCTRIVLPVLGTLAGIARWPSDPVVRVVNADAQTIDLWWHRPVRLIEPGLVELAAVQTSGDGVGIGATNGFVEVPPRTTLAASSLVAYHAWG